MAAEYRVVDCRRKGIDPEEIIVRANTPEQAARLALGEVLVRGSAGNKSPRARVYFHSDENQLTLVRLYASETTPCVN